MFRFLFRFGARRAPYKTKPRAIRRGCVVCDLRW